jgi:hypothetical protein
MVCHRAKATGEHRQTAKPRDDAQSAIQLAARGEISVRAALNKYERATNHGLSFANVIGRARSADAHARPLCPLAPARHHGLSKVPLGVPFATSRANSRLATLECRAAIHPAFTVNGFGARCRRKSKLAAARLAWGNCVIYGRWVQAAVRAASFHTVARRGFELASAARTGAKLSALTPQTNCV